MSTLQSPGVSVRIIDDSLYADAGPGTVPLIVATTRKNKRKADGSYYEGTLHSEDNKLRLVTSRNELISTYGDPVFDIVSGTVNHGSEISEYGLHAAWRALDQVNRVYVLTADIDLAQLAPTSVEPSFPVPAGTHWLDLNNTHIGIFKASNTEWEPVTATIITDVSMTELDTATGTRRPKKIVGMPNDIVVVSATEDSNGNGIADQVRLSVWQKIDKDWYLVGSDDWETVTGSDFQFSAFQPTSFTEGDIYIRTSEKRGGTVTSIKSFDTMEQMFVQKSSPLFEKADDAKMFYQSTGNLFEGQVFVKYNDHNVEDGQVAVISAMRLSVEDASKTVGIGTNEFTDIDVTTNTYNLEFHVGGTSVSIVIDVSSSSDGSVVTIEDFVGEFQPALAAVGVSMSIQDNHLVLTQMSGNEIVVSGDVTVIGFVNNDKKNTQVLISNWVPLVHEVSFDTPKAGPVEGTLWFNDTMSLSVYKNIDGAGDWVAQEVIVRSEKPVSATSGTIWVDSLAPQFPTMYVYDGTDWKHIDNTNDEIVVFGGSDSRETYDSMINLLFVDLDESGMVVKQYQNSVWKAVSGLAPDGTPYTGNNAQRQMIVSSIKRALSSSKEARSNVNFFNLISAPGFMEALPELNSLNVAKKQTAFVLGSTPMNLPDNANFINQWANNQMGAFEDGERGLVTFNNMSAIWAFAGLQSTSRGNLVAVPSDIMALEVLLQNDRVAYPWFAPAGDTRGLVPGTSAVGYTNKGSFEIAEVDDGLLDTLYTNNINPIINFPNEGIKAWGQKTLTSVPSALDRINVARLTAFLRYMLERITRPFLFEQNDVQTRQAVANVVEKFLADIVQKRGITDFVVVCDTSNNTPARIDRNELWVDIAFVPTKSVEFIYVPVRIVNTGDI